jgi:hypothetical protein
VMPGVTVTATQAGTEAASTSFRIYESAHTVLQRSSRGSGARFIQTCGSTFRTGWKSISRWRLDSSPRKSS